MRSGCCLERLLGRILGERDVPQDPVGHAQEAIGDSVHDLRERSLVPPHGTSDEIGVHTSSPGQRHLGGRNHQDMVLAVGKTFRFSRGRAIAGGRAVPGTKPLDAELVGQGVSRPFIRVVLPRVLDAL
jgi:hypothetical protein